MPWKKAKPKSIRDTKKVTLLKGVINFISTCVLPKYFYLFFRAEKLEVFPQVIQMEQILTILCSKMFDDTKEEKKTYVVQ